MAHLRYSAFSGHFEGMQKKYHCALVFLMFFCSTMHSSLQWFFYSSAVNSNEGTDGVQLIKGLTDLAPWLEATGDAFFCLNIFIADWLFVSTKSSTLIAFLTEQPCRSGDVGSSGSDGGMSSSCRLVLLSLVQVSSHNG